MFSINVLISSSEIHEKGFSFEIICNLMNSKFASRTTILNILEEGVTKQFLTKTTDIDDHRKQSQELQIVGDPRSEAIQYKHLLFDYI